MVIVLIKNMENNLKLIELTVTLKESQLKTIKNGDEFWEVHFDNMLYVTGEREVKVYTAPDRDPTLRLKLEEIESFTTTLIFEEDEEHTPQH